MVLPVAIRTLSRDHDLPLWVQLEADLQIRLEEGEFDERFPTDHQLVEEYGVSRHTVREAIGYLNKTGLLRRKRGRGTVVNRTEFEQTLGSLYSLFQSIEASGVEQTSEVLALEIVKDSVAADHLGLDGETDLVYLERLRLAGGEPLAVDRTWLPLDVGEPLLDRDFSHTALYIEIEASTGSRPNRGWERLMPIIPTAGDRQHLSLGNRDAAFRLERLGFRDDTPIEWRVTTIRGDRYRFVADWSMGATSELKLAPN